MFQDFINNGPHQTQNSHLKPVTPVWNRMARLLLPEAAHGSVCLLIPIFNPGRNASQSRAGSRVGALWIAGGLKVESGAKYLHVRGLQMA